MKKQKTYQFISPYVNVSIGLMSEWLYLKQLFGTRCKVWLLSRKYLELWALRKFYLEMCFSRCEELALSLCLGWQIGSLDVFLPPTSENAMVYISATPGVLFCIALLTSCLLCGGGCSCSLLLKKVNR